MVELFRDRLASVEQSDCDNGIFIASVDPLDSEGRCSPEGWMNSPCVCAHRDHVRMLAHSFKKARFQVDKDVAMDQRQRKVLVTGGSSGIGRELVGQLADAGDHVVTCGRNAKRLEQMAMHPRVEAFEIDLAGTGAAETLARTAIEVLGGLDLVVANAGTQQLMGFFEPHDQPAETTIRNEVETNFTSIALLAAHTIPELARSHGRFAAITSGLAYAPKASSPVYCATKSGVHTLLDALRYQAQDTGSGVLIQEFILPVVITDMTAGRNEGEMPAPEAAARIIAGLSTSRDRVAIGKARLLMPIMRVAPSFGRRMLRGG